MAFAQDEPTTLRPVTSSYTYEIGGATLANTYLTPLKYKGWDMALNYERMQAMKFNPEKWVMRLTAGIDLNRTDNPAKNATMWRLVADFSWGMTYRFKLPHNITLAGGGSTSLDLGCVYNARNGNNPVAAIASAGLDIAASLSRKFRIGRMPVEVSDEIRIPTLSAFFCPQYGESYYEIYLGNHKGLAHCGWWGNAFGIDNLISFKMNFGRTGMLIGYRFDLRTFRANSLETQIMRNAFVIGIIPYGF